MEYRKICKTCGNVFCYTDEDVADNKRNNIMAGISALGAAAGALSGNWGATLANQSESHSAENKIKDFYHCPHCHSTDLVSLSDSEWEEYKKKQIKIANIGNISINTNASVESLIKRVEIFIENEDFISADAYTEKVLDMEPEYGYVYFLKLLIEHEAKSEDDLVKRKVQLEGTNYSLARKYGDDSLQDKLNEISLKINEIERRENEQRLKKEQELDDQRREKQYQYAKSIINSFKPSISEINQAIASLIGLGDYKDSQEILSQGYEIRNRLEDKNKKIVTISVVVCILAIFAIFIGSYVYKRVTVYEPVYQNAIVLYDKHEYEQAQNEFEKISSYKDSAKRIQECIDALHEETYLQATEMFESGEYYAAKDIFEALDNYKDSADKAIECEKSSEYDKAIKYLSEGSFDKAKEIFIELESFRDSAEKVQEWDNVVKYYTAENYWETGYYQDALQIFSSLGTFYDSEDKYKEYQEALSEYREVITILRSFSTDSDYESAFTRLNWKLLEKNGNNAILICLDETDGFNWEETQSMYEFMIRNCKQHFNENDLKHIKNVSLPSREMLENSRPFDDNSVLSIDNYRTGDIDGYLEKEKSQYDGKVRWYIRPVIEVSLK